MDHGWIRSRMGMALAPALVALALAPGTALAGSVATTGNATSVTTTRAQLNGVIDPGYSDSAWFFEWSTSPTFATDDHHSQPKAAGAGPEAVGALVGSLTPSKVYYFRVGVIWQADTTQGLQGRWGNTSSFRTLSPSRSSRYGTARVSGRVLRVRRGAAQLKVSCHGAAGAPCRGRISLTVAGARRIGCGSQSFSLRAPHARTLRVRLSPRCAASLARGGRRRLTAQLRVVFSTHQAVLVRRVTLAG